MKKITMNTKQGNIQAAAPVIISASRSTDIPAFYSEWFFNRLDEGWLTWINPFNQKPMHVSFRDTRMIVFWTKNPEPILPYLKELDEKGIGYYFTFTLNDYEKEHFEPGLPSLEKRIEIFKTLSERIGKEKVIWRFDPLIMTEDLNTEDLLGRIKYIGDRIFESTEKLVISFAEIEKYKKVKNNMRRQEIPYQAFDTESMVTIARGLEQLNKEWNLTLAACAEDIDLSAYGIIKNKCIDDELMIRLFSEDQELMDFLGYGKPKINLKDKGQRPACQCVISKDIGRYNTCPHQCLYCYANTTPDLAKRNYEKYLKSNKEGPGILSND